MVVRKCTCQSEYQDRVYGKGNRICNETEKSSKVRCTVCGKEL